MNSRFSRTPAMTGRAKVLRRRMSPIEQKLWHGIRGAQLGVSFRRQRRYVVDFYCPSIQLAVELERDEHATRAVRDEVRTQFLNEQGIHVIRFTNRDVNGNLDGVREAIALEIGRLGA